MTILVQGSGSGKSNSGTDSSLVPGSPNQISDLFANGAPGAWYDPNDLSTMFDGYTSAIPVSSEGRDQPVGFILDKSQGLNLGPELIYNGGFDSNDGWIGGSSWSPSNFGYSISSGVLTLRVNPGSISGTPILLHQTTPKLGVFKPWAWYKLSYRVVSYTNGGIGFNVRGGAISSGIGSKTNLIAGQTYNIYFYTANYDLQYFEIQPWGDINANGSGNLSIDNLSVKEIYGNHAFSEAYPANSRPLLSARVNLLFGTQALASQTIPVEATTYKLRFEGTGSITLGGVGSGTYTSGTYTITISTAGGLIFTVSGSVQNADFRYSSMGTNLPNYQAVDSVGLYYTVQGFPRYLRFNGVDSKLCTIKFNYDNVQNSTVFAGVQQQKATNSVPLYQLNKLKYPLVIYNTNQEPVNNGSIFNLALTTSPTKLISQVLLQGNSSSTSSSCTTTATRTFVYQGAQLAIKPFLRGETVAVEIDTELYPIGVNSTSYNITVSNSPDTGTNTTIQAAISNCPGDFSPSSRFNSACSIFGQYTGVNLNFTVGKTLTSVQKQTICELPSSKKIYLNLRQITNVNNPDSFSCPITTGDGCWVYVNLNRGTQPFVPSFVSQSNVPPGTVLESNQITLDGYPAGSTITVTNGQYSLNGGAYTSNQGTLSGGGTAPPAPPPGPEVPYTLFPFTTGATGDRIVTAEQNKVIAIEIPSPKLRPNADPSQFVNGTCETWTPQWIIPTSIGTAQSARFNFSEYPGNFTNSAYSDPDYQPGVTVQIGGVGSPAYVVCWGQPNNPNILLNRPGYNYYRLLDPNKTYYWNVELIEPTAAQFYSLILYGGVQ